MVGAWGLEIAGCPQREVIGTLDVTLEVPTAGDVGVPGDRKWHWGDVKSHGWRRPHIMMG